MIDGLKGFYLAIMVCGTYPSMVRTTVARASQRWRVIKLSRLAELLFAMSDFVSGEKQTEVLPGGTPSTVAAETAPSSKPVEDNPSEAQPQQVTTRGCASCTT
jgi:hypothetical protein